MLILSDVGFIFIESVSVDADFTLVLGRADCVADGFDTTLAAFTEAIECDDIFILLFVSFRNGKTIFLFFCEFYVYDYRQCAPSPYAHRDIYLLISWLRVKSLPEEELKTLIRSNFMQ